MTTTLLDRLTAAIDEDERIARDATPGPWRVDNVDYPESIVNDDYEHPVAGGRWGDEATIFERVGDAFHIARQDPKATLLRCAADRKIVERHSKRGKSVLRNGEFIDYCAYCQQPIPCPDLRDLALAHDLTVEED